MKIKNLKILILVCLSLLYGCHYNQNLSEPIRISVTSQTEPKQSNDLEELLRNFSSTDKQKQLEAQENIIIKSNKSNSFRQRAIEEMLNTANKQKGPVIFCGSICYQEWKLSVETLGKIKAEEAIDYLISCLSCNDGSVGQTINWYPSLKAIVNIGEPTIFRLKGFLLESEKHQLIRLMTVDALQQIGTKNAKVVLKEVLLKEQDELVSERIKEVLRDWNG